MLPSPDCHCISMPLRSLLTIGFLLLATSVSLTASAQDQSARWQGEWAYPLAPCVGPLADAATYRYSSAYGHALACIDYGTQGEARAVLKYFSNASGQWLPDLLLEGPAALPSELPQTLRLLATTQGTDTEILVLALEFAPSQASSPEATSCPAPSRREEVRAYALTRKQALEVDRHMPNPCVAVGQRSDSWAWVGRTYGAPGTSVLVSGRGERPYSGALNFNVDKDGNLHRTFPFSL